MSWCVAAALLPHSLRSSYGRSSSSVFPNIHRLGLLIVWIHRFNLSIILIYRFDLSIIWIHRLGLSTVWIHRFDLSIILINRFDLSIVSINRFHLSIILIHRFHLSITLINRFHLSIILIHHCDLSIILHRLRRTSDPIFEKRHHYPFRFAPSVFKSNGQKRLIVRVGGARRESAEEGRGSEGTWLRRSCVRADRPSPIIGRECGPRKPGSLALLLASIICLGLSGRGGRAGGRAGDSPRRKSPEWNPAVQPEPKLWPHTEAPPRLSIIRIDMEGGREKIQIIPREQYETFVKTEGELECSELVWKDYKKGSEPTMEYVMSSYRSWNLPTRRIFRRVLFKPSFSLSKAEKMKIRRAQGTVPTSGEGIGYLAKCAYAKWRKCLWNVPHPRSRMFRGMQIRRNDFETECLRVEFHRHTVGGNTMTGEYSKNRRHSSITNQSLHSQRKIRHDETADYLNRTTRILRLDQETARLEFEKCLVRR
ncbi:unnamed protein product [Nesidiocoris tenuis]|uniref:Uncharacterized protein n=1 Tax=Nesidiocoris tenuis TaxID=355587 RepID=A0A6H5GM45_9HEMI|nr:unnamed protein product [Nesidiocoris tenuis]